MGLAHDLRRATARIRREQQRRNREMEAETRAQAEAAGIGPRRQTPKIIRVGAPENKIARAPVAEDKAAPPPLGLGGVPFASDRAREIAEEAELTADDFTGQAFSGASGFTAGDVRGILEED